GQPELVGPVAERPAQELADVGAPRGHPYIVAGRRGRPGSGIPCLMRILAISGSLRARSSNAALLRAFAEVAPEGTEVMLYGGRGDLPHFNADLDVGAGPPAVAELRRLLRAADGLVISSPEYAHGLPGSLKNALDWVVSSGELSGMPVVLLNAATSGGERAQAALVQTPRAQAANVLVQPSFIGP